MEVASSVASSTPQTETSTTVGTVDAIECTALDLCATALTQQEIVNPRWIAFNVDTGAGGTAWPMNADYACEHHYQVALIDLKHEKHFQEQKQLDPIIPEQANHLISVPKEIISDSVEL